MFSLYMSSFIRSFQCVIRVSVACSDVVLVGATAPPSGNISPPVGEKITIRRGIFTDGNTYAVHIMSTCY